MPPRLAQRWGRVDPAAALGFAWDLAPVYFEKVSEAVLNRWLRTDARGAAGFLASDALPIVRARLGPAADAGMAHDPRAAAEWVETNLSGRARVEGLSAVVRAGAGSSPLECALIAEGLPDGPVRHGALRDAAQAWFSADTPSALAWADTLPPACRGAVVEGIARSALSPEQRAAALAQLAPPPGSPTH